VVAHGDRFYGLTGTWDFGGAVAEYAVLMSADGRTWTEVTRGDFAASDLIAFDGGLAVAYEGGIATSSDGATWTAHSSDVLYRPALAWADDRFLRLASGDLDTSTDGNTWASESIADMRSIDAVLPVGADDVVVVGEGVIGERVVIGVGMLDLDQPEESREMALVELPSSFRRDVMVTAAGILDSEGNLAPITAAGIGTFAPFAPAFATATTDGTRTVMIERADDYARYGSRIAVSDGNSGFQLAGELPIVRIVEE
jgi:hypothetical protein